MEIGIDIEEIERFDNLDFKKDKSFFDKIYTKKEIKYCLSKAKPSQHFAVRYAGKEAVTKALAGLRKSISYNKIEILNKSNGNPNVNLKKNGLKKLKIGLSLSHSKNIAIASVIIFP